jgi:D-beta-D-heptose 7-phosphate kinase/D-beta-D-heptose 1-phosphate adenosyltransferase
MSRFKVAVIGDFMQDLYWLGDATRISPEAPIPVVKINEVKLFPGGAGNVAKNLEALGCEVVWYLEPSIMPRKNRLMVGGHQLARWDENDWCAPIIQVPKFLECDAVIVADYAKGAINEEIIWYIKEFAGPIFVDTKRDPSVWSGAATAIFPNSQEYDQFSTEYLNGDFIVIQKRGQSGLSMRRRVLDVAKTIWEFNSPAQARFVRSVNGAGDTVIAAFVFSYLAQNGVFDDWKHMLDFANAAAAVSVEHPYTYAPTLKEVEERYYQ